MLQQPAISFHCFVLSQIDIRFGPPLRRPLPGDEKPLHWDPLGGARPGLRGRIRCGRGRPCPPVKVRQFQWASADSQTHS